METTQEVDSILCLSIIINALQERRVYLQLMDSACVLRLDGRHGLVRSLSSMMVRTVCLHMDRKCVRARHEPAVWSRAPARHSSGGVARRPTGPVAPSLTRRMFQTSEEAPSVGSRGGCSPRALPTPARAIALSACPKTCRLPYSATSLSC
ncbi:uncharacterized protein LOC144021024 [Festucalex cinctus]